MPIIRNPFRKQDENVRPTSTINGVEQKVNGNGADGTNPSSIREKEPAEYKLSEINDSGVYLPPSPPERKSFWTTSSSRSTTSSTRPSLLNDSEPFNISRESFDSYRRSFDISARSPVIGGHNTPRASLDSRRSFQPLDSSSRPPPRQSLDSRTFQPPPPRSSNSFTRPSQVPAQTQEETVENFEDVDIADKPAAAQPKKRGLFSRITDSGVSAERPTSADGPKSSWHHFGGRKRGQSGQGAELGSIPKRETTPKPESMLRREGKQQAADGKVVGQKAPVEGSPKFARASEPARTEEQAKDTESLKALELPRSVEPQAQAGAERTGVEDGMRNVSLSEPIQKDVIPQAQPVADPKAPTPQNSQAPAEVKV